MRSNHRPDCPACQGTGRQGSYGPSCYCGPAACHHGRLARSCSECEDADTIQTLTAERANLAAQVAALTTIVRDRVSESFWCDFLADHFANLPTVAKMYIAAHRVAQAYETVWRESNRYGTSPTEREALADALAEWRKAAESEKTRGPQP